jgi:hypothetical protein
VALVRRRSYLVSDFCIAAVEAKQISGIAQQVEALAAFACSGDDSTHDMPPPKNADGILPRGGSSAFPARSHLVPRRHTPMLSGKERIRGHLRENRTRLLLNERTFSDPYQGSMAAPCLESVV